MLGNLMIGPPVSGLMILGLELLDGMARELMLLVWRYNLAYHPTHVVLDLGCTRSIGSRSVIDRFLQDALFLWHYNGSLPLQQIFRVCQLRNRKMFGKLHYSLSNNTTMFDHF